MKASIIICVYTIERLKDIHEAVTSVSGQSLRPHEIIISVDHNEELYQQLATTYRDRMGNCRDSVNIRELPVEQPPVPIILVLNAGAHGLSETRNAGIRVASGDVVAFIDDDAIAEKDWLEKITGPFQNSNVVAVGGKAIPLWPNGKRPAWFPEELDWLVGCSYKGLSFQGQGNEIRNVPGCNMAFKKELFEQIGFWRTDIGARGQSQKGGEEAELCLRVKRTMPKAMILYEPHGVILHKVPSQRARLKWLVKNSFDQGICKAKLQRLSPKPIYQTDPLAIEKSYLRYLLFVSILGSLKRFYRKSQLLQAGAMVVSIAATGVGYVVGRARE